MTTGKLYIVATPIGNLQDITLRALETLKMVDLIAAEDTRHSKKLLAHYGIDTPLISLHDYNESEQSKVLLAKLQVGKNLALISDAGTPLISDPGYRLVHMVRNENIIVVPIPGACAAICALSASGLASDRFTFEGFLPAKSTQRISRLEKLQSETRTMIFYESPHRIIDSLNAMLAIFGSERKVVYARELTKTFETIHEASLQDICEWVKSDTNQQKGEIVILIAGLENIVTDMATEEARRILNILSSELLGSKAVEITRKILNNSVSKKAIYQLMLGQLVDKNM